MADAPSPTSLETTTMFDLDGNPVQVPVDQVADAHLRGGFAFARGSRVNVIDPNGYVHNVDESEAERVFKAGYRPATSADIQYDRDRAEYDTTPKGLAISTGHGVYKGATLGFGDPLLTTVGGEGVRNAIEKAQQFNPGYNIGGEVVGGLAMAAATSGGSVGGSLAGRALSAPMRGVNALGNLAERGVARAIGTEAASLGGRVAQAGFRWGARGAAEGAVYEAGMAISDAAIKDHELTAERFLTALGDGMLVGGLGGAAIGGVGRVGLEGARGTGRVIGKGVQWTAEQAQDVAKSVEALAEKTWGKAAPGLGERYVQLQSALTGADPATLKKLGIQNLSPEAQQARKLATFGAEQTQADAVRTVRRDLDRLAGATSAMSDEARGAIKIEHVNKIVKRGNEQTTLRAAQGYLDEIKKSVNEMLVQEGAYGQRASLLEARKVINHYETRIAKRIQEGLSDNAQLFADLDHIKQRIGKWAGPGRHIVSADQATHGVMRKHYESLRQILESDGLWGSAGKAQREINEAWTKYLDTKELFEQSFARAGLKDATDDFWTRKMVSDPAKIEGFLKNIGLAKQDLVAETLQQHIKNSNDLSSVIAKNYSVPSDKAHLIKEVSEASKTLSDTLKRTEETVGLINQLKALEAADNSFGSGMGAILGGAIGSAVGLPGALIGGVASIGMNPGRSVRQLAAIEHMVGSVSQKVEGGIGGFISKAKERASAEAKRIAPKVKEAAKKAGEATVEGAKGTGRWSYRGAVFASSKASEARRNEYERQANSVRRAVSDPEAFGRAVYARIGGDDVHPQIAASTIQAANRATSFLATKLPPTSPSKNPLQPRLEAPRVSDAEMSKFLRYAQAVEKPLSVIEDLRDGKVSREGVEALKAVYPKMYQEIQLGIAARVGELNEKLVYSDRIQLGILFDVATDASLDPSFVMNMQSNFSQEEVNGMAALPPGRPLRVANQFATEAERVGNG